MKKYNCKNFKNKFNKFFKRWNRKVNNSKILFQALINQNWMKVKLNRNKMIIYNYQINLGKINKVN